jgi:hypothetical protein
MKNYVNNWHSYGATPEDRARTRELTQQYVTKLTGHGFFNPLELSRIRELARKRQMMQEKELTKDQIKACAIANILEGESHTGVAIVRKLKAYSPKDIAIALTHEEGANYSDDVVVQSLRDGLEITYDEVATILYKELEWRIEGIADALHNRHAAAIRADVVIDIIQGITGRTLEEVKEKLKGTETMQSYNGFCST